MLKFHPPANRIYFTTRDTPALRRFVGFYGLYLRYALILVVDTMYIYKSTPLPSWQESCLESRFRSPIGDKLRDLAAAIQALTLLRPARCVK